MAKTIFVCVSCDQFKFADTVWMKKPDSDHFRVVIDKMKRKALCDKCTKKLKEISK